MEKCIMTSFTTPAVLQTLLECPNQVAFNGKNMHQAKEMGNA
jgi:hypothetical protein